MNDVNYFAICVTFLFITRPTLHIGLYAIVQIVIIKNNNGQYTLHNSSDPGDHMGDQLFRVSYRRYHSYTFGDCVHSDITQGNKRK